LLWIGYLSTYLNFNIIYGLIFIIEIGYYLNNLDKKTRRITTEVSLIATYLLGIMVNKNIEFAIYTAVLVLFLLNLKSTLTTYEKYISRIYLNATVTFLLITFIVLPILPNRYIDK
jgi:uncharacterized membrane protein (DUF4010 family)